MENASKALLLAGAMLLIILVLTFAIYLFGRMARNTSEYYEAMSDDEINEFNQAFFNYDGKNNLTIHDVVSILNLAKSGNKTGRNAENVNVKFGNEENFQNNITQKKIEDLLEKDLQNKETYSCTVEYANNSRLVGKVIITKNP